MISYAQCPVCKSADFKVVLKAKDYTVSGDTFSICHCNNCSLRFTNPVPAADHIGKYYQSEEYISHSNTSRGLINSLYQKVRKRTLRSKKKLIEKESGLKSGELLDIGSGAGAFLSEMQSVGWNVKGLEPDENARDVAKKDFNVYSEPIQLFFDLEENKFDVITMWHVLEHVHQLDEYMSKINRLLKKDGLLIIAVPNYNSRDAEKYKSVWAAYDVPRHLYHFTVRSMKVLLERSKFKLVRIKRMPFDSFYVSMLSEKYRNGSMIWALWNGFWSYFESLFSAERCSSVIYIIRKAE